MRASIFISCLIDLFAPEVGESMVRVLRQQGVDLDFPPGQTCCGQPAWNTGYREEARRVAEQLVLAFDGGEHPIVSPSGSCTAMIRHHYDELFADDPELRNKAQSLAERVYEFSEFMIHVLGVDDVGAEFPATATYHTSCHMSRYLGLWEEPKRLLKNVSGLELVELPRQEECCGFGGTFSVKLDSVSTALVEAKVEAVRETGADVLVGSDWACLMNISGRMERLGVPVRVMHVAQVLDEGLHEAAAEDRGGSFHGQTS